MGSYDSMDGANLVLFKSEFYILQNKNIKNYIVDFYRCTCPDQDPFQTVRNSTTEQSGPTVSLLE